MRLNKKRKRDRLDSMLRERLKERRERKMSGDGDFLVDRAYKSESSSSNNSDDEEEFNGDEWRPVI